MMRSHDLLSRAIGGRFPGTGRQSVSNPHCREPGPADPAAPGRNTPGAKRDLAEEVAALKRPRLWVGHWNSEAQFAFCYYVPRLVVPWCPNWVPTSVVLRNATSNWKRYAGDGPIIPLEDILTAPQQWGFGIEVEGAPSDGEPPLAHWLGFDGLSVSAHLCPAKD